MAKILLDTNIIVDYYDESRQAHATSKQAVDSAFKAGCEVCVAATSCKDVYFLLSKVLGESAARNCIQSIFFTMELLPVDNRTAYEGFHSSEPDFEDGIVRACVEINRVDFLVTRDKDAFKGIKAQKVSPIEMTALLT
jgi:predicted nucleic acid-binding protein